MIVFLRVLLEIILFCLCKDGVAVSSGGIEILSIEGIIFRYAFISDFLYYMFEYLVPYLYEKINFIFTKLDKDVKSSN